MKKPFGIFRYLAMIGLITLSLLAINPTVHAGSTDSSSKSSSNNSGGGKSSSGGFSSGSKSASSTPAVRSTPPPAKSSGGFSNGAKDSATTTTQTPPQSSAGFSASGKSAATATHADASVGQTPAPPKDAAAMAKTESIAKEQAQKAMADYQAEQAKFKQPAQHSAVTPAPAAQHTVVNRVIENNYHYDSGNYANRTRTFYDAHGWGAPAYASAFFPSYGLWNTLSLLYMIDHIHDQQYAMMYYSHRNDDDMRKWREQAEIEARNNTDLKAKLAAMDSRMQAMEQQGIKGDPGYIPTEMAELALNEDTLKNAAQRRATADSRSKSPAQGSHWFLWTLLTLGVLGCGYYLVFKRKWK